MNNITNRMGEAQSPSQLQQQQQLNRSLPVKPTTRIKIVKRQKAAEADVAQRASSVVVTSSTSKPPLQPLQQQQLTEDAAALRMRSVSPGNALRRAPDIIETIETKTSMSFIMNKSVNMVVEEKRELPPPPPPRHSSVRTSWASSSPVPGGLSSAISQPQLYQTRIDDLISTANDLIKNSSSSNNIYDSTSTAAVAATNGGASTTTNKTVYKSKFKINNGAFKKVGDHQVTTAMHIPINVQSRSKSEPKLDFELENQFASYSPRNDYRVRYLFWFERILLKEEANQ